MSTAVLINYDLCAPGKNYEELIKSIKESGTWGKVAESCWFLETAYTPKQLRDNLKKHMDENDRLFVAELTGVSAWTNVICDSNWLKEHLEAQIERKK